MSYLVVIEKGGKNYSAYVPDIPGCVATGKTRSEVRKAIASAVKMHLKGLREDGLTPPESSTIAEVLEIA